MLCLGAHADDIEIGAGGALLEMQAARPDIKVHWVVFSAHGGRADEARRSADRFLSGCQDYLVDVFDFRDGYLPHPGSDVKDCFEELKTRTNPDLVVTHDRDDLHQDHRFVSELTWNTFRSHLILEYEIPKYDGGLRSPNVFVELRRAVLDRKIEILMDVFASQRERRWFAPETFEAIARLRGLESRVPSALAEGFHCRKAVCSW